MGETTRGERFWKDIHPVIVCPYCHHVKKPFDRVGGVDGEERGGFWLKNKKTVSFLMGFLRKEFSLDSAKASVRKLAKSAGIVIRSYDLAEFKETLLWHDLMADQETASLLKSILSERELDTDGSTEALPSKRGAKIMPLVLKRKIWWKPVPEASSYVVYLSEDPEHFEPDNFLWEATPGIVSKQVVGKTEVILPDDWPEFPKEPGTYYIGVTSKDALGNQSNPFIVSGSFKFLSPPAPSQGGIESF